MGRAALVVLALVIASCGKPGPGADPAAPSGDAARPTASAQVIGPLTAAVLGRVVLTLADAPAGFREVSAEQGFMALAPFLSGAPQDLMDAIFNDPGFVDARSRRFGTNPPVELRGSWAAMYVDEQAASRALKRYRDWFASAWFPGAGATDPGLGDEGFRFDGVSERNFGKRVAIWMWREDNLILRVFEGDAGPWSAREMAERMDSRIR